jgi:DNA-binding IclR family transcriptional regulator
VASSIGAKSSAHASAMAKVLLAGLSRDKLSQVLSLEALEKFTPMTITDKKQIQVGVYKSF